jgi:hypothetical protein
MAISDGTVDLAEANKAASTLFDKLDRDHDGILDRRELGRRLSTTEFASADSDKDGTLKDEYLKVLESRFKAADPDNDATLDEKELRSRAGRALLRLLQRSTPLRWREFAKGKAEPRSKLYGRQHR